MVKGPVGKGCARMAVGGRSEESKGMVGGSDLITSFRSQAGRGFVLIRMEATGGFY